MKSKLFFPLSGELLPLKACPEPVFADKTLGDGFVIKFDGTELRAPFDGTILASFPSGHTFIIKRADGLEVMLHVGLQSANKAEAFSPIVTKYQKVSEGQVLTSIKLEKLKDTELYCPVIFSNPNVSFELKKENQHVSVGDTEAVMVDYEY